MPFCEKTDYRVNMIKYDMNEKLGRHVDNVPIMRKTHTYNLKHGVPTECQLWTQYVGLWDSVKNQNLSATSIHELPDKTVLDVMVHGIETEGSTRSACPDLFKIIDAATGKDKSDREERKYRDSLALLACANCNKKEAALGQHKKCTRCNQTVYCCKVRGSW